MRIPDDLKFSDVWVTGQIPPTEEDEIDAWINRIHSELQHKVLRDGLGLPHLRVIDSLEPLGDLNDGGVNLAGKVTVYARVPRADWIYVCDDMTNLFDEICAFDVQVDVDHDYFIDE